MRAYPVDIVTKQINILLALDPLNISTEVRGKTRLWVTPITALPDKVKEIHPDIEHEQTGKDKGNKHLVLKRLCLDTYSKLFHYLIECQRSDQKCGR